MRSASRSTTSLPGRRRVDRRFHRGAAGPRRPQVVAVDVGYGQLAWTLRSDPRVMVHRTYQRARTDRRRDRRTGRPRGRRSVVHLAGDGAACADRLRVGGRGYRSHGEATVRGRQGSGRRRWGRVRPGTARGRGARRRAPGRRTGLAHRRRHGQPAARSVGQRRVLPASACAPEHPCRATGSSRR